MIEQKGATLLQTVRLYFKSTMETKKVNKEITIYPQNPFLSF